MYVAEADLKFVLLFLVPQPSLLVLPLHSLCRPLALEDFDDCALLPLAYSTALGPLVGTALTSRTTTSVATDP